MSGKITKISLNEALKAAASDSQTDWERLRSMSDEDIDAAIASDPDTWAIDDEELKRRPKPGRYEIYRDVGGQYRWRLLAADGSIVADGAQSFATLKQTKAALASLHFLMLSSRPEAA